jgi:acetyl-CoA acetyltransferase
MKRYPIKDHPVCVVGIASTGCRHGQFADRTAISVASEVTLGALQDAGLKRSQIDGLAVHIGSPRGNDYDLVASMLGLNIRFSAQPWSHGRFGASVIQEATMALTHGLADYVLCLAAYRNSGAGKHGTKTRNTFQESLRDGGGPHAETPYAGFTAPGAGAAMAAQRYFDKFGVAPEKLAAVALADRKHAIPNPLAAIRKPLSFEEYMAAPFVVEPLRLFDFSREVDGAVALILTSADRARDCLKRPVDVLGFQGISAGPQEYIFGQPGLGFNQADVFDYKSPGADQTVYKMAGLEPADIDLLQVYDAFSPNVLWTLERLGHCKVGEAADWIQNGRIEIGGDLPVNTSGGMLSEGHLNGWPQFFEIVTQLRHEAGERQVADAKLAQWGTCLGDSIVFGRNDSGSGRTM